MHRSLIAFALLAGLAGGAVATPAGAAPLGHGLTPVEAAPSATLAQDPAMVTGGAAVETVQFYRRRYYGYGRGYYRPRFYRRYYRRY